MAARSAPVLRRSRQSVPRSLVGEARACGDGRVPTQIPKAQGERCVEDTDDMRRNHMTC